MSVSAAVWKQIVSKIESPRREALEQRPTLVVNSVNEPAFSLMHQLFPPRAKPRRRSILLAAVDSRRGVNRLCEQIAIALSKASGEMVGVIERDEETGEAVAGRKMAPTCVGTSSWHSYLSPVAERVRRIPQDLLLSNLTGAVDAGRLGLESLQQTFAYLLLAACVSDTDFPLLCPLCEAAVLVVTANVTRREAALRAKEQIVRHGVTLLGTVLDQRSLPIPEAIYRRL